MFLQASAIVCAQYRIRPNTNSSEIQLRKEQKPSSCNEIMTLLQASAIVRVQILDST